MNKWVQLNEYGDVLGGLACYEAELSEQEQQTKRRLHMQKVLHRIMEEELTTRQKQVMLLYYFDGKTMTDIAVQLGVNKSTVSRTVANSKRRIERCMKYWL